jgi:hypothetical protein
MAKTACRPQPTIFLNGNMLVGVWKDSLIVRLGQDQQDEALREQHVREFDITGRPMRNWCWWRRKGSRQTAS